MAEIFARVAKMGDRKIVYIPKYAHKSFLRGDNVIVRKVTPKEMKS